MERTIEVAGISDENPQGRYGTRGQVERPVSDVATYSAKGDSFAADKPRVWAETQIREQSTLYWNLDLAPDGKRFVVAPRPETGGQKGSVHVTVLLSSIV